MDIVIGEQVKKVVKLATVIIGVLAIGASAWGGMEIDEAVYILSWATCYLSALFWNERWRNV